VAINQDNNQVAINQDNIQVDINQLHNSRVKWVEVEWLIAVIQVWLTEVIREW